MRPSADGAGRGQRERDEQAEACGARETPKARRKRLEAAKYARAWSTWVPLSSIHTRLLRQRIAATAEAMSNALERVWSGVKWTWEP